MYCINCGKEIRGNIPICGKCLQGVLDKHKIEQDVLTRVTLEAQHFCIKAPKEETNAIHEKAPANTQNITDDDNKEAWVAFAIIICLVIVVTCLTVIFATIYDN